MPFPPRFAIHHEPCPDYLPEISSCADQETAEIWLAPDASRFERWHELGHLFDAQVLDERARSWFTPLLGFPADAPWFEDYGNEFARAMPGERFADAYAACALDLRPGGRLRGRLRVADWETAYGYQPTTRAHHRICNGIVVLALVHV